MLMADLTFYFFALGNGLRIVAYVPQLVRLFRAADGAQAVSCVTWSLFAAANLSTVLYAAIALRDPHVTIMFLINGAFCLAIVIVTFAKRQRCRGVSIHTHPVAVDRHVGRLARYQPDGEAWEEALWGASSREEPISTGTSRHHGGNMR